MVSTPKVTSWKRGHEDCPPPCPLSALSSLTVPPLALFLLCFWRCGWSRACPWKGLVVGSEGPCQLPVAGSGPVQADGLSTAWRGPETLSQSFTEARVEKGHQPTGLTHREHPMQAGSGLLPVSIRGRREAGRGGVGGFSLETLKA